MNELLVEVLYQWLANKRCSAYELQEIARAAADKWNRKIFENKGNYPKE